MRNKALALSGAMAVALAVGPAGCGSSHRSSAPSTSPSTTATTGTSTVSSSTTSTVSTTTSTSSTTSVPSGPQPCTTAHLSASLGAPNGAAGTVYYMLQLANTGTSTCTMSGYPGVSFVTGSSGTEVGAPAARTPGTTTVVTLAAGASAHAVLGVTEASNFGPDCDITNVNGLRVYPPGQTAALFVPHTDQGCVNKTDIVLHIGPLASG